jgi:hypothetical protein
VPNVSIFIPKMYFGSSVQLLRMRSGLLLSAIFFILFSGCIDRKNKDLPDLNSFLQGFKNPPAEYSTAPFWVWNDSVTTDKIDWQLRQFRNNGIHQVFIHPRPGLITEYLSPAWFELVAYAVKKGRELEMKIWLYDENSFPSGSAGGHVPASLPANADLVVGLKMQEFTRLPDDDLSDFPVILKKIGNTFANISNGYRNYLDEEGEYYAFSKWYYPDDQGLYGGFSYVDLLAYGITERFIRITMKGYEEYVGDEFGRTIPGIFTDEPHIHTTSDPTVIKYTPVLFSRFAETYGYPLENYLPSLFEKTGDWKNVRHDYYALLLDMFIERWAKPWMAYADSNRLNWTGHYWEHTWPNPAYVSDNMALYALHQVPGIDMLFNDENRRPDQFGNTRVVKELGSVANQLGKRRRLSETYGGSGWDLNFMDMKRLGDWEFALGVNFMNQHLSYMTIKGARKRDFPLSFSYHSPWWDQYGKLNAYFHRLSYALSAGEQINKILVLEPTTTAWMYYSPGQARNDRDISGEMKKIDTSFRLLLDSLEKHQVEYDLGSEKIIAGSGRVDADRFVIGDRKYSLVLLPPKMENLEQSTFDLLTEYIHNDGKLLILGQSPTHIDGNLSRKAEAAFSEYTPNPEHHNEILSGFGIYPTSFIPRSPEAWKGRVFHQRRELADGDLLFLNNFDTLETANIRFSTTKSSVYLLDPFTGEINAYPAVRENDQQLVGFELPPAGSILLYLTDKKKDLPETEIKAKRSNGEINGGRTRIVRNGPNVITLDYCDLEVKDRLLKDIYFYNAADTIFREYLGKIYGFNYNPWSVAVQYRTYILDKNSMLDQTAGFTARFEFFTGKNFVPENLKAVIENPGLISAQINGFPVAQLKDEWWLDREFGVYDLSGHIRAGKNQLTIKVTPMNVLAELEPVYLLGNFSVIPAEKGWEIHEPGAYNYGSWQEMGLPFFSESISYIREFEMTTDLTGKKLCIELPDWQGTVAEVRINGEHAGLIGWPPYSLDVTGLMRDGNNEVEVKVYGSLKNLLGPHHNDPVAGLVTPWSFFYAPSHQPPGRNYDLKDYGLMTEFKLKIF